MKSLPNWNYISRLTPHTNKIIQHMSDNAAENQDKESISKQIIKQKNEEYFRLSDIEMDDARNYLAGLLNQHQQRFND